MFPKKNWFFFNYNYKLSKLILKMDDEKIGDRCEICKRRDYIPFECKKCKKKVTLIIICSYVMNIFGRRNINVEWNTTLQGLELIIKRGRKNIIVVFVKWNWQQSIISFVKNVKRFFVSNIECLRNINVAKKVQFLHAK